VESAPLSAKQVWHSDSSHESLTFVFALSDQTLSCGPTQFVANSQQLFSSPSFFFQFIKTAIFQLPMSNRKSLLDEKSTTNDCSSFNNLPQLQAPLLQLGEVMIFDSRLIHRGLGNETNTCRPILVSFQL